MAFRSERSNLGDFAGLSRSDLHCVEDKTIGIATIWDGYRERSTPPSCLDSSRHRRHVERMRLLVRGGRCLSIAPCFPYRSRPSRVTWSINTPLLLASRPPASPAFSFRNQRSTSEGSAAAGGRDKLVAFTALHSRVWPREGYSNGRSE